MTKDIITLKEDASAKDAIKLLLEKRISGIPIVSDNMKLVGVVTEKDLLELSFYDTTENISVSDIMTSNVVSMDKETDLLEICEFFMHNNYKRIPIVSDNTLVGIISRKDMLKYILEK
ncbi:MAG: CBS domain-containing protein [Spirochaetota bacterium]